MISLVRRVFRRVTPAELAAKELADAELELLTAHSHCDHAQASINYNEARIKRLRTFLTKLETT